MHVRVHPAVGVQASLDLRFDALYLKAEVFVHSAEVLAVEHFDRAAHRILSVRYWVEVTQGLIRFERRPFSERLLAARQ